MKLSYLIRKEKATNAKRSFPNLRTTTIYEAFRQRYRLKYARKQTLSMVNVFMSIISAIHLQMCIFFLNTLRHSAAKQLAMIRRPSSRRYRILLRAHKKLLAIKVSAFA
jgi:phage terminase Nu1 subunit (DNA packaging protein)